jgi:uridine nucleosidase
MACPPNTAWLVTTGTLTNAASLFSTFPKIVDHLRGLSIMGGAVGSGFTDANLGKAFQNASGERQGRIGNHTPFAEFNIWCDPESSQSIFSNPQLSKKTSLITLDLTHQVFATPNIQDMVLHGNEEEANKVRRMFFELLSFFAHTYSDVFGLTDGPPLHDPLAVAVLLNDLEDHGTRIEFDDNGGERFRIDIELTEPELGRTKANPTSAGVRIPRSLDTQKFWQVLISCLERADKRAGKMHHPS